MTNLEKIRKMSAEELAETLETILNCDYINCSRCKGCILSSINWRKQTVKDWIKTEAE